MLNIYSLLLHVTSHVANNCRSEDDINFSNLELQFQTISPVLKDDISLSAIVQYLVSLSEQAMSIYSEIVILVELILVSHAGH